MTKRIKRLSTKQRDQLIGEYFFSKGCPPLKDIARHFKISDSSVSNKLTKYMKERSMQ